jgi:hypothetical protein
MPKDYQEIERIVEDFLDKFPVRNPEIEPTIKDWLRTTLTTYGNARELQGVEKVIEEYDNWTKKVFVAHPELKDEILLFSQSLKAQLPAEPLPERPLNNERE